MSSTSALKAIATDTKEQNPVTAFRGFLEKQKHQLQAALPKHMNADRMIRLACTEFAKNPKLQQCTPISVFGAIIQSSQLGLEIGVLGQAYLVPFYNNKKKQLEAQFLPGYKGLISLARRSGEVTSIETNIVYAQDKFTLILTIDAKSPYEHEPYLDGDRGAPRLVYGVAKFKDGGHHFEWMTISEVNKIRARSQSANAGPWVTDYDQMVRKTLIRRMANYLPMSIELSNALQIDEAADQGKQTTLDGDFVVVQDNDDDGESVNAETGEITTPAQQEPPPLPPIDPSDPNKITFDQVAARLKKAPDLDMLDAEADLIREIDAADMREQLTAIYNRRKEALSKKS
jgi:recombination protein RecT